MKKETVLTLTVSQCRGIWVLLGLSLLVICGRVASRTLGPAMPAIPCVEASPATFSPGTCQMVELNTADTTALLSLPGIGPVYARRILKYRAIRGGFDLSSDLMEVYGMDSIRFAGIQACITVDVSLKPGKEEPHWVSQRNQFSKTPAGLKKYPQKSFFEIQINQADSATWTQMPGIGPGFAQRIVRYRAGLRGFDSPGQLKEVFGLPEETFTAMQPYLRLDSSYQNHPGTKNWLAGKQLRNTPLDLNEADSTALEALPGIGPKTAARIIKFRQQLGFFLSVSQLREVWGMRDENYEIIAPLVGVSGSLIRFPHLRINTISKDEFGRHPYIGWKEAKILVAYREMHGNFRGPEDFTGIHGLKSGSLEAILPYLDFSDPGAGNMANLK